MTNFFVYGTLKVGESNHDLIAPFVEQTLSATARGLLYDCGPWPALVEGDLVVHGELMRVDDAYVDTVLPVLDRLEGYNPADEEHSPYVRRVIQCQVAGVGTEDAYVYFYTGLADGLKAVPSGRWSQFTTSVREQDN